MQCTKQHHVLSDIAQFYNIFSYFSEDTMEWIPLRQSVAFVSLVTDILRKTTRIHDQKQEAQTSIDTYSYVFSGH